MEYTTFLKLFERTREQGTLKLGSYSIDYYEDSSDDSKLLIYTIDGHEIGSDYYTEVFSHYKVTPEPVTSFENGICDYDRMVDYLNHLYDTYMKKIKEQEKQERQENNALDEFLSMD